MEVNFGMATFGATNPKRKKNTAGGGGCVYD